jgi:hypothetical protein
MEITIKSITPQHTFDFGSFAPSLNDVMSSLGVEYIIVENGESIHKSMTIPVDLSLSGNIDEKIKSIIIEKLKK